jgi:hypothetical protein
MFAEALQKGINILRSALDDQLHISVIQVFNRPGKRKIAGEMNSGSAEANTLHTPGKTDSTTLMTHHACPGQSRGIV